MLDNPGQHRGELCAFGRVEGSERLFLRRGEHPVEIEQSPAPALGEGDDVASPIGGVGGAYDETTVDECVDGGGDVAAVESAAPGEVDLTGRTVFLEGGQDPVVVTAGIGGVETVEHDAMDVSRRLGHQIAREVSEPIGAGRVVGGGHVTESTITGPVDRDPVTADDGR